MTQAIRELDTKGLNCPLPILRLKKEINALASGDEIRLIATDPGSLKDVESFCKQTGNQLLSSEQNASEFTFMVRKS